MSMRKLCLIVLAAAAWPVQAQGGDTPFWLHLGAARVAFDSAAEVTVPAFGGRVAGQSAQARDNSTLALELGYAIAPNLVLSATVGIPPVTELTGVGGPLAGARLGSVKYGPSVWSAHYHWPLAGLRPYVGGGLTYVLALASRDATLTGLEVKNALGGALQAGVDIPLTGQLSAFVDVKKLFVKAKARFDGPAPGTATVRLDPLIVHAGIGWRF